jgi:carbonic anhydrase
VNAVVRRNVRNSANRLLEQSDIILDAVESGEVQIVTAFFHFSDGRVEFDQ